MNVKRLLPIIGIIILLILLIQFDFSLWLQIIQQISPIILLLSLTSSIPIILITNIEWQYLLKKQGFTVSSAYTVKNILIGYFFGFITPGGIGAYTRALYLEHETKEPMGKCLSNIVIFNTIDIVSLISISIIGAFLFSNIFPMLFMGLLIFCIIWISFIIIFIRKKTWKWILNLIVTITLFESYAKRIKDSIDDIQKSLPSKKSILITILLSIFGWILRFSIFFLVLSLFSITVPYIYVIFIIAIANIIAMIPISIYGLGTREAVLISLFSIFGVSSDRIIGVSLFWFFLIWIIPSIIGGIISLHEGRKITENHHFFSKIKESHARR